MRLSIFALPLIALQALSLQACDPAETGGEGGSTNTTTTSDTTTSTKTVIELDDKGCPINGDPAEGASCPTEVTCTIAGKKAACSPDPGGELVCAGGAWNHYYPLTCSAPGALTCDPVGVWKGTRTGDYVYLDGSGSVVEIDHIDFEIVKGEDGVLRAGNNASGSVSDDGCQIDLYLGGYTSCEEHDGQSFCDTWASYLKVDLSKDPPEGEYKDTCNGECQIDATAPFQFEKQP